MSIRRILIAADGSSLAAHAVEVGSELARSLGSEVALIYVVDPAKTVMAEGGVPAAELMRLAEQDGRTLLAALQARSKFHAAPRELLEIGKPATEIVKAANGWEADLIVVASHGRSGVGRLVLGSVAEEVMRHAPCSVLVVRAPQ